MTYMLNPVVLGAKWPIGEIDSVLGKFRRHWEGLWGQELINSIA